MGEDDFIEHVNGKHEKAWRELYRKYYPALCNYVVRIVKDNHAAEDVVQECFIKLWDGECCFPNVSSLVSYLYRVVYTRALNVVRDNDIARISYQQWGDVRFLEQEHDLLWEVAVEEDVVNKFYAAVDKLSSQQRQVISLCMKGTTVKDIAKQLSISENSVKTQKKRAYAFIRAELGEMFTLALFLVGLG